MKFLSMVTLSWLILLILNQFKGNNSCITEASLTKHDMHHHNTVKYVFIKKFMKFCSMVTKFWFQTEQCMDRSMEIHGQQYSLMGNNKAGQSP